jgi:hypothetical protein
MPGGIRQDVMRAVHFHSIGAIVGTAAIAGALWLAPAAGLAQRAADDGPFSAMAGNWSGNGTITLSDNTRERIRCRASYKPDAAGETMALDLRCASDSYKFDLQSNIRYAAGKISGIWSEASRNAAGAIFGTASGGQIEARAEGQTFAALLSLTTRGNRQAVSIRSPGSALSEAAITLSKN